MGYESFLFESHNLQFLPTWMKLKSFSKDSEINPVGGKVKDPGVQGCFHPF